MLQTVGVVIVVAFALQALVLLFSSLRQYVNHGKAQRLELEALQQELDRNRETEQTEQDQAQRAWSGLRKFVIDRKQQEGGGICSFYLKPQDEKQLPSFKPGQYLTFQLDIPGENKKTIRCYSLSDGPRDDYYRVSIKKVLPPRDKPDVPPGRSSSFFHESLEAGDVLDVRNPNGEFFLDTDSDSPVVLIGGGVGITPMMSMLNALAETSPEREVWLFYGVRNSEEHIMKRHFEALTEKMSNFHLRVCYSDPGDVKRATNGAATIMVGSDADDGTINSSEDAGLPTPKLIRTDSGEAMEISQSDVKVGRASSNAIVFSEPQVSGKHARLYRQGIMWFVEDLGSTNGTFVNGEQISEPQMLNSGEEISFAADGVICRFDYGADDVEIEDEASATIGKGKKLDIAPEPEEESLIDQSYILRGKRVSVELMKELLPANNYDFYICGPPPMMEAVTADLEGWGVPTANIHFESFGPASVKKVTATPVATEAESSFEVAFAKSGKIVKWNPSAGNLLDFAEENGLVLDSGCRAGNCGTCAITVRSGEVHYPCSPGADTEPGTCLACVAVPKGDISLDA